MGSWESGASAKLSLTRNEALMHRTFDAQNRRISRPATFDQQERFVLGATTRNEDGERIEAGIVLAALHCG